jgi:acetoacetyl-CoA synthetase
MDPLWKPNQNRIEEAQLTRFADEVSKIAHQPFNNYGQLHRWSVENCESFWSTVWDFSGIIGDKGSPPFVVDNDQITRTQWFPEARLNFAENLLQRRDDHTAIVSCHESGGRSEISFADLYLRVAQISSSLKQQGIKPFDRVAGFLPNGIDSFAAMLATTSLGAVWTSCSPDFGLDGVIDRFGQVKPKVLFTSDSYSYNGKKHDCRDRVSRVVANISSIERTIVFSFLGDSADVSDIPNAIVMDEFLDLQATEVHFHRVPFQHPLVIMYSSGTTGKPKCIVHCVGGVLLEHQKEHRLHTDLGPDDVLFYYSTCGWMMWNWMASALACGSTIVAYDGSPFCPSPTALIDLIDREQITAFGVSAKYISAIRKEGLVPRETHDLGSLKTILSTGSPLAAEEFQYIYEQVKSDVLVSSISGGTDLLGCFLSGNPCLPVYAGQLQCPGLAMQMDVVDNAGNSLETDKGELICRNSFPSMPIGFWNDANNEKYHDAYFSRIMGVWSQGDFAQWTNEGGMIIHGRSDAVLNPGGVRIGTSEIYRQVDKIEGISESMAVGQKWDGDCRIILFVTLSDGYLLNDDLCHRIRTELRTHATPRHVPAKIIQVAEIPRTRSGKIVELAVTDIIHGRPVKNMEALANPTALDLYKNLPQLSD